jgi:transposase
MNPIEQVWREIRTRLANRSLPSIETLLTELCKVIDGIPPDVFASITQRNWIMESPDLKDK